MAGWLPISLFICSGGGMNCVSCDIPGMRVPPLVCFVFSPGVFLSSRVTGESPVTTDLIMRVDGGTTTNNNTDSTYANRCIKFRVCLANSNSNDRWMRRTFMNQWLDWNTLTSYSKFGFLTLAGSLASIGNLRPLLDWGGPSRVYNVVVSIRSLRWAWERRDSLWVHTL